MFNFVYVPLLPGQAGGNAARDAGGVGRGPGGPRLHHRGGRGQQLSQETQDCHRQVGGSVCLLKGTGSMPGVADAKNSNKKLYSILNSR